jgi:hypothetical protein
VNLYSYCINFRPGKRLKRLRKKLKKWCQSNRGTKSSWRSRSREYKRRRWKRGSCRRRMLTWDTKSKRVSNWLRNNYNRNLRMRLIDLKWKRESTAKWLRCKCNKNNSKLHQWNRWLGTKSKRSKKKRDVKWRKRRPRPELNFNKRSLKRTRSVLQLRLRYQDLREKN